MLSNASKSWKDRAPTGSPLLRDLPGFASISSGFLFLIEQVCFMNDRWFDDFVEFIVAMIVFPVECPSNDICNLYTFAGV